MTAMDPQASYVQLGQKILTRLFIACSAIAFALLPSAATIGSEGRPRVVPTDYDNIAPSELISVYRQAYVKAGFKVKRQSTRVEKGAGGRRITRLVFEYVISQEPVGKMGIVSYLMSAPASEGCTPCSVFPELLGPDPTVVDPAVWTAIYQQTLAADLEANAEIKEKLGRSVRSK
jgi:hypothetical protein